VASLGLPYAADTWWPETPPALPYVLVVAGDRDEVHADNGPWARFTSYAVELYTHGRDDALEDALADALAAAGVARSWGACGVVDETDVHVARLECKVYGK
jgi:hypothetical protein